MLRIATLVSALSLSISVSMVAGAQRMEVPGAEPEAATAESPPLVIDVRGLDEDQLRSALALRLSTRAVSLWAEAPTPPGASYALVDYAAPKLRVTLIQPGGDAYDRTLESVHEQPLRTAAVELTTLIDAVGAGTVAPTRTDVPLRPSPNPNPSPSPSPNPSPSPSPSPNPSPSPSPSPSRRIGLR